MTKRFSFTFIVILFTLSTNFAVAAGAPDPVFWFAGQADGNGVNLMVSPEQGIAISSFELEIKVQTDGSARIWIEQTGDIGDTWQYMQSFQDGTIKIAAVRILPLVETVKFLKLNIKDYCGKVRIIFRKALTDGHPEIGGTDMLAADRTEDIVFVILPQLGDVDADGRITTADVRMVLLHIIGLEELTPEQWVKADVTNLGGVTTLDAMLILQYVVGIITEFSPYSGKGAPAKNPLSFDEMVEQLRASEEIDDDIIDQLVDARDHEQGRLKKKLLTTWGGVKQRR